MCKSREMNVSGRKEWPPVSSAAKKAARQRLRSDHRCRELQRAGPVDSWVTSLLSGLENK